MSAVQFSCTNPQCRQALTFDPSLAGSLQHCPNCHQQLIVPQSPSVPPSRALVPSDTAQDAQHWGAQPHAYHPIQQPAPFHRQPQQESAMQHHTARRLNMGAGCFSMLAVMFGFGVVGWGFGLITHLTGDAIVGLWAVLAGLAGIGTFVFFGYIATETSSSSSGRQQH